MDLMVEQYSMCLFSEVHIWSQSVASPIRLESIIKKQNAAVFFEKNAFL